MSPVGYSPWGSKRLNMTEGLTLSLFFHFHSRKYSVSNNYLADDLGTANSSFTSIIEKKKKNNI